MNLLDVCLSVYAQFGLNTPARHDFKEQCLAQYNVDLGDTYVSTLHDTDVDEDFVEFWCRRAKSAYGDGSFDCTV